jgi:hypothetical protein
VLSAETITAAWEDVLQAVKTASVRMSLKNSHVRTVRGSVVTLAFASGFHRDKVKQIDAARQVEEAMQAALKQAVRIECVLEEDAGTKASPAQDMVNLAEAAAEVF